MKLISDREIDELEKLNAKIPYGNFEVIRFDNAGGYISFQVESFFNADSHHIAGYYDELTSMKHAKHDAEFDAMARNKLSSLLARLRSAEGGLKEMLDHCVNGAGYKGMRTEDIDVISDIHRAHFTKVRREE